MTFWQPAPASAAIAFPNYYYENSSFNKIKSGDGFEYLKTDSSGSYSRDGTDYSAGISDCHGGGGSVVITTVDGKFDGDADGYICGDSTKSVTIYRAFQAKYVDHSTVQMQFGGQTLTFQDGKTDGSVKMSITGNLPKGAPFGGCTSDDYLDGFSHSGEGSDNENRTITYHSHYSDSDGNCQERDFDVHLSDPDGVFQAYFAWKDSGTISTSDEDGMIFCSSKDQAVLGDDFKCGGDKNTFLAAGGSDAKNDSCQSEIDPDPADPHQGKLILRYNSDSDQLSTGYPDSLHPDLSKVGDCYVPTDPGKRSIQIVIADPPLGGGKQTSDLEAGSSDVAAALKTEKADASNQTLGCDYRLSNPLTWILCPVIQLFTRFAAAGDYIITKQLTVNGDKIFCDTGGSDRAKNTCQAYYDAWTSFRNIALGIMVVAGLVMLIAQALGMEILDAYTIRKVLPRLLVAAIGITLSWTLMNLAVNLANDLGIGIRELIYQPFADLPNTLHINMGSYGLSTLLGGGTALIGGIGFAGWLLFGGIGVIVSLCGTAALAVLVAVLVLVLRQIAITMMILVAPIAIVCFIMPNTQKVYHVWWESFSKALLMFPMIAGMIATGRVFSAVANSQASTASNSLDGLFYGFAAFIAYFAPYFLIPATFKLAGGALRQIGGFVNDRSKGGFDRLRNQRAERRKKIGEKKDAWKKGDVNNPLGGLSNSKNATLARIGRGSNRVAHRFGQAGQLYGAGWRGGYGVVGRGKSGRADAAIRRLKMEGMEHELQDPAMKALGKSNAAMRFMQMAAMHHGDEAKAEKDLRDWYGQSKNEYGRKLDPDEIEGKVAEAKGHMRAVGGYTEGRALAAYMMAHQDGTAIRDYKDSLRLAAMVSGGDDTLTYDLLSQGGGISKQKNRPELMPSQDWRAKSAGVAKAMIGQGDAKAIANAEDVVRRAQLSAAAGSPAWVNNSNSPERVIRENMELGFEAVSTFDPSKPMSQEQIDDAVLGASIILDHKNSADQGQGTQAVKMAIDKAMGTTVDGTPRDDKLQKFLSTETGNMIEVPGETVEIREPDPNDPTKTVIRRETQKEMRPETYDDVVKRVIGDRYTAAGLSDAQKQAAQGAAAEAAQAGAGGGGGGGGGTGATP